MRKRAFIDTVRQFQRLAVRKRKSYAESVDELQKMYMNSVVESGATEAEIQKELDWSTAFVVREYASVDAQFPVTGSG